MAALLIGPLGRLIALIIAAVVVLRTDVIEIGVAIAVGSCLLALVTLGLLQRGRTREEPRYEQRLLGGSDGHAQPR